MEFSLEDKVLKVSEFNELFDRLVSYQKVIVEGEISQVSVSQNKWLFLTLKDSNAQIEIFAIAFNINTLSILREGMLVHVYGTPHIHQKSGRFRITAEQIIPAGVGELKVAFELLKLKLEKEGIFSAERKRPLPEYPSNIALLTAENSQAYHDFIKVLGERTGGINIKFFPIAVQGADSVSSIVKALNLINKKFSDLDFAVLTRGGGSLEDLQAFNAEEVVRAIYTSKIPVVSAVGHEKDVTLSDLVADLRASTPSNAAELVSKDKKELLSNLEFWKRHLENLIGDSLKLAEKNLIESFAVIESGSKDIFYRFETLKTRYVSQIEQNKSFLLKEEKLFNYSRILDSLSYEKTLKRGFSITSFNNVILRDVKKLTKGDIINTRLYKGEVKSKIEL